jgi:hypothetical protein
VYLEKTTPLFSPTAEANLHDSNGQDTLDLGFPSLLPALYFMLAAENPPPILSEEKRKQSQDRKPIKRLG